MRRNGVVRIAALIVVGLVGGYILYQQLHVPPGGGAGGSLASGTAEGAFKYEPHCLL